jgi:hypothetical protein
LLVGEVTGMRRIKKGHPARMAPPLLLVALGRGHLKGRLFGDMLRRTWALPMPAG